MMSSGRLLLDSSYRTLIGRLLLRITARTEIETSVAWAKLNTNWKAEGVGSDKQRKKY